jgi:hypothetical protein
VALIPSGKVSCGSASWPTRRARSRFAAGVGRTYLGSGWQRDVEDAVELGFSHLSLGFNRMANPGVLSAGHLDAVSAAKAEAAAILR